MRLRPIERILGYCVLGGVYWGLGRLGQAGGAPPWACNLLFLGAGAWLLLAILEMI